MPRSITYSGLHSALGATTYTLHESRTSPANWALLSGLYGDLPPLPDQWPKRFQNSFTDTDSEKSKAGFVDWWVGQSAAFQPTPEMVSRQKEYSRQFYQHVEALADCFGDPQYGHFGSIWEACTKRR